MKLIVFWDYNARYILNQLHGAVTHSVVGDVPVEPHRVRGLSNAVLNLKNIEHDACLIALANAGYLEKVMAVLRSFDMRKPVYIVKQSVLIDNLPIYNTKSKENENFLEERIDYLPKGSFAPYIAQIETHICDNCNLNCVACSNFSPFFKKKSIVSVETWERDFAKLSSSFMIGRVILAGGEPLLEPEVTKKFIEVTRKYVPHSEIHLASNGLLVSSMKSDFWQTLADNNVFFSVSVYPPTANLIKEIWHVLNEHGIKYFYHKVVNFMKRLNKCPVCDAKYQSEICISGGCHPMRDGYIYKCYCALFTKYVDQFVGTRFEGDCGISLDRAKEDPLHALDVLTEPVVTCRFCDNEHSQWVKWQRVQGEPAIDDWLIDIN